MKRFLSLVLAMVCILSLLISCDREKGDKTHDTASSVDTEEEKVSQTKEELLSETEEDIVTTTTEPPITTTTAPVTTTVPVTTTTPPPTTTKPVEPANITLPLIFNTKSALDECRKGILTGTYDIMKMNEFPKKCIPYVTTFNQQLAPLGYSFDFKFPYPQIISATETIYRNFEYHYTVQFEVRNEDRASVALALKQFAQNNQAELIAQAVNYNKYVPDGDMLIEARGVRVLFYLAGESTPFCEWNSGL